MTSTTLIHAYLEPIFPRQEEKQNENSIKDKHIEELFNPEGIDLYSSCLDFKTELAKLPFETLQSLYENLRNVFTVAWPNSDRLEMIKALRCISEDQWRVTLQQVNFIMPLGTKSQHVICATEILVKVTNPEYRKNLVNVANRFFEYDTPPDERAYLLKSLALVNLHDLNFFDIKDKEARNRFLATLFNVSG